MNRLHAESVLECGGKRGATPLSNCLTLFAPHKAPSPLRSTGALQKLAMSRSMAPTCVGTHAALTRRLSTL